MASGLEQMFSTCTRFNGTNRQIVVAYLEPVDLSGNFLGEKFSEQVRAGFLRSALHNAETIPRGQPQGQGLLQGNLYSNIHGLGGIIPRLRHVLAEDGNEYEVSVARICCNDRPQSDMTSQHLMIVLCWRFLGTVQTRQRWRC